MENKFFYCYNRHLARFLSKEKSIRYICHAIHPRTKKDFFLFHADDELTESIEEYKSIPNRVSK